jgi:predicted enzyme related to lactoylglutathione lyase
MPIHFRDAMSGFSVDDLEAAHKFYSETLGLTTSLNQMGILDISLPGGGKGIAYPKTDHQPATYTCLNLAVDDIDATVDALIAAGVAMEQYGIPDMKQDAKGIARSENGPAIAWFKDPAGNILSVIQVPAAG